MTKPYAHIVGQRREHRGPMLPCGHPVALLVFDGVDGTIYRCPQCARDRADLVAQAGDQP